jgi:aminopeptidase N
MRRTAAFVAVLAVAGASTACTPRAPVAALPAVRAAVSPFKPGSGTSGDLIFPDSGNGGYDVTHYGISVDYRPSTNVLTGQTVVNATATQDLSRFDLDLVGLTVTAVLVDGKAAAYDHPDGKLVVTPAAGIRSGSSFTVDVRYNGQPESYDDPAGAGFAGSTHPAGIGSGGFVAQPPERAGALAQGEPMSAAYWFPVNDRPTDKATYDIAISAPSALTAISNGVLTGKQAGTAITTWHWRESDPMASYLALLAIGSYRVQTGTHGGLPVFLAVDATLPTRDDTVLADTPALLDFVAQYLGPYPFDAIGGVVHGDARIGYALENQTRPAYASGFFDHGDPRAVIVHELAHQWCGDSVSVADWSDVWLNEGFATYLQFMWAEQHGGPTVRQRFDRLYRGTGADALPPVGPLLRTAENLFDDSVYLRGFATLEALRITVGDDAFFRILKGWPAAYRFGNATTADFIAYADRSTGARLDDLLYAWLTQPGVPAYP